MGETKKIRKRGITERIPIETKQKANSLAEVLGIDRTTAHQIMTDSCFQVPKFSIENKPRSKKKILKLWWEKQWEL